MTRSRSRNATPDPVEFDEFTNMFDEETRAASQTNLKEFGDALAGRGASINQAIGAFRPLLEDIIPVAQNLASPETNLTRLIVELADAARIVAPAAESQAALFVNLDATFGALREVARPYIQESISEGPATLDAAIESFPVQRPFLANTEGLFRELQPGAASLATTAPSSPARSRSARRRCAATRLQRRGSPRCSTRSPTFAEDPLVPRGIQPPHRDGDRRSSRRSSSSRPPSHLQLPRRCGSATSPRCSPRATTTAPGSGS